MRDARCEMRDARCEMRCKRGRDAFLEHPVVSRESFTPRRSNLLDSESCPVHRSLSSSLPFGGAGLEVFGFNHFLVGSRCQCVVDVKVNELSDHADRAVRKDELGTSRMVASKIFEVANRAVGCVV